MENKCLRNTICMFLLALLSVASCEVVVPHPYTVEHDALLELRCVIADADSAVVDIARRYAITHDHRIPPTEPLMLNSSLIFMVNGKHLDYRAMKGEEDKYIVSYPFASGDRIDVYCSAPGLPDIEASTTVPEVADNTIESFDVWREGYGIKGSVVLNDNPDRYDAYSVEVHVTMSEATYVDGKYMNTEVHTYVQHCSMDGTGRGVLKVMDDSYAAKDSKIRMILPQMSLSTSSGYTDPDGKRYDVKIKTDLQLKVGVLSKELYLSNLYQGYSYMSPYCYTNIKGGLGCLGAMTQCVSEIITFGEL